MVESQVKETKAIARINNQTRNLDETAKSLNVVDDGTAHDAVELLAFVATAKKNLEEQRVFLVKPLNDHVKAINAKFKEWTAPLDTADKTVRRKVLAYQAEQEVIRVEAQRLADEARVEALGDQEEETLPDLVVPRRAVETGRGTASVRKTWEYEIEDEDEVPRKYLMIDEGAIAGAVRQGIRGIPGVRIYQKDSLSVRTR